MVRAIFIAAIFVIFATLSRETGAAAVACSRPNEEFTSCGTACPPECNKPAPQACTLQCVIGCQCKSGYLRKADGSCVAPANC